MNEEKEKRTSGGFLKVSSVVTCAVNRLQQ